MSWRCASNHTLLDLLQHRLLHFSCYLSDEFGINCPCCVRMIEGIANGALEGLLGWLG
jgi:hypothetical protein